MPPSHRLVPLEIVVVIAPEVPLVPLEPLVPDVLVEVVPASPQTGGVQLESLQFAQLRF
jgi:hypothetical protein